MRGALSEGRSRAFRSGSPAGQATITPWGRSRGEADFAGLDATLFTYISFIANIASKCFGPGGP